MNEKLIIEQPQGKIVKTKNGVAKLVWNKDFKPKWQKKFNKAQVFVDTECIRRMRPYTPFKSGVLDKSATLGTQIGSGKIVQVAPYARYQYYGKLMVSSITGSSWSHGESKILTAKDLNYSKSKHPNAGPFWFERMKAVHKNKILEGARRIAGGKK